MINAAFFFYRVFAPPNSFLLLLYSPVKPTPEFWECCVDLVTIIGDILLPHRIDISHFNHTIIFFVKKIVLKKLHHHRDFQNNLGN